MAHAPPWTEDEDRRLAAMWAGAATDVDAIARRLGRTPAATKFRASLLRLTIRRPNGWTREQDARLRAGLAAGATAAEIAARIPGKSRNAVIGRKSRLRPETAVAPPAPPARPDPEVPPAARPEDAPAWACIWPAADGAGRLGLGICGRTRQPGRDFCAEHCTEAKYGRPAKGEEDD